MSVPTLGAWLGHCRHGSQVLLELEAEDWGDLGLKALGHRKIFGRELAALKANPRPDAPKPPKPRAKVTIVREYDANGYRVPTGSLNSP